MSKTYLFFWHKIKTKNSIDILRHASLQMNVAIVHTKYEVWILNIKQDIRVQKILFSLFKNIFTEIYTNPIAKGREKNKAFI